MKGITAANWRYYYDSQGRLYYERLAQFCHAILVASGGVIIVRLEKIYSTILIDEVQDMGGYDLKIIEAIYQSKLNLVVVGRPSAGNLFNKFRSFSQHIQRG